MSARVRAEPATDDDRLWVEHVDEQAEADTQEPACALEDVPGDRVATIRGRHTSRTSARASAWLPSVESALAVIAAQAIDVPELRPGELEVQSDRSADKKWRRQ